MNKAQLAELERNWRDRNKRLKEMGMQKQSFEEFIDFVHGRNKKETRKKTISVTEEKSSNAFEPQIPTYTYRSQGYKDSDFQAISPFAQKSLNVTVLGPTSSKPAPTYTGTKMIGIGTMHKSNMVPIFSDQEAEDISKMRR